MKTSHMDVLSANGDSFGVKLEISWCRCLPEGLFVQSWCCLFLQPSTENLHKTQRLQEMKAKYQFWGCDFWMSGQSTYYNQSHRLTWVLFLFEKSFSSQWFAMCWFDSRKIQQKQAPLAKRISDQKVGRYPKVWNRKMAPKSGDQDHRDPCM